MRRIKYRDIQITLVVDQYSVRRIILVIFKRNFMNNLSMTLEQTPLEDFSENFSPD